MSALEDMHQPGVLETAAEALRATGDPVDAERARLIGFMLVSRGADLAYPSLLEGEVITAPSLSVQDEPLTHAEIIQTETSNTEAAAQPVSAEDVRLTDLATTPSIHGLTILEPTASLSNPATTPSAQIVHQNNQASNGEDILLGSSEQIYGHLREGLLARFQSTHEVGLYAPHALSVSEEYAEQNQREIVAAETAAYTYVGDVVDRLIPRDQLGVLSEHPKRFAGLSVESLDQMKRVLATVIFDLKKSGYYDTPDYQFGKVVVGAGSMGSNRRFQYALLMDVLSHEISMLNVHRDDLDALVAQQNSIDRRQISENVIKESMSNDRRFQVDWYTKPSIRMFHSDDIIRGGFIDAKLSNLQARGLRVRGLPYKQPDLAGSLKMERLPERVIDEFEVPRYLADLVSVLAPR